MSHFTKVKTKITDLACLQQALKDLGYQTHTGNVRGYGYQQEKADVVVALPGKYDIGFKRLETGQYEVVADWWGVSQSGLTQESFIRQVNQRYAYRKVLTEVQQRGFTIAEEETQQDQSIRLIVRRW